MPTNEIDRSDTRTRCHGLYIQGLSKRQVIKTLVMEGIPHQQARQLATELAPSPNVEERRRLRLVRTVGALIILAGFAPFWLPLISSIRLTSPFGLGAVVCCFCFGAFLLFFPRNF